ncbi:hypothetical protein TKK_0007775 [Trichogramma kaykai]
MKMELNTADTAISTDIELNNFHVLLRMTNSSDNASYFNSNDEIDPYYFYETEQFTIMWLLFALIVIGNTAVLAGLARGNKRKSRMNFFIQQLATADLLVGLISVLTDIVQRSTVAWYAGNFACKFIRFLQVLVTYSSTYVLVALSIDRHDAITKPFNFSKCWSRSRCLVVLAWVISTIFSSPILFLYEEKVVQNITQCWIDMPSDDWWRVYMTLVALTLFFLPALIISACYAIIVKTIWSSQTGALMRSDTERNAASESGRGIIPRAKIKTIKMTLVIVLVFILCWSPYMFFDLLQVYGYIPKTQTATAIASLVQSLAHLNSAANPIIYCLFSSPFCQTTRNCRSSSWFPKVFRVKRHQSQSVNNINGNSTRTTITTSLTAHSSKKSGHTALLKPLSRKPKTTESIV